MRAFNVQVWSDFVRTMEHHFLNKAERVEVGEWQSQKVGDEIGVMHELRNVSFEVQIPVDAQTLVEMVRPNVPWAEEHFQERVSGWPLNPPPSHERWPFRRANNSEHMDGGKFSHTYPERFWPKKAGDENAVQLQCNNMYNHGIRFEYGDLMDVVTLLKRSPHTRQAYLPVWFPEDTGAVHEQRVPCTIGYLFQIRRDQLHCVYYIRSCDFMRHFADDVYMAGRLTQWVAQRLERRVGELTMHVASFHIFQGDVPLLEMRQP